MAVILLVIGDNLLREPCVRYLAHLGYGVIPIERPLAVLGLGAKVRWDIALLDDSPLGREALAALSLERGDAKFIGVGFSDERLQATLPRPVDGQAVADAIEALLGARAPGPLSLSLDAVRRTAAANGREVALTRTEFRLLEVLLEFQPREVPLLELLQSVWGFTEGRGTSELVRAHVRNLRLKLDHIGLADAIRSRRGRGYALVL